MIEGRDHTSGSGFIQTSGEDIELSGATAADQDFIAHARQDIPRLLEEVRRLSLAVIECHLIALLASARDLGVPTGQLDDMTELARAGEPGVALESFCTQLSEYAVAVPAATLAAIVALGNAMGLADTCWTRLARR